jgi:serine/threonine protein kinase
VLIKCPKCHSDNPDDTRFCGNCAAPLHPSEEISAPTETLEAPKEKLTTGSTFAERYQIIEELGKGGMGKVYRALDKELNEEVALKLIKPEIAADKKTIERFKNELKLARKISHKNIGRMYELMEKEGTRFITMEYVRGEDLKSFIYRLGQLAVGTAVRIAKQVCEGLSEAHKLSVVHRDLKSSNIMIDKDGNVRIMDFGIARSLKTEGLTEVGMMIGTPEYMSPEQVEGKAVDQRSDFYSLGIIIYEMLTERTPFKADLLINLIHKHLSEPPEPPSAINPQIPEELEKIILKCLEKKPEDRYQTSEEIIIAINKVKPTSISAISPRETQRNSIAVLSFADLSPQKDQEYFCDGLSETIIDNLAKIKDIKVVARTSAFSFKGKEQDIREIGRSLNVQTVLEGSVQKAGNRLRISAQLVDTNDGFHIWSERFDRDLDDVFAIQDELSLQIVDKLKIKVGGEERNMLVKRYTENIEAYNLYLKGRYHWEKITEEGLRLGLKHFQQAIEKDPTYALAYAGIADCYVRLGWYAHGHPKEVFPRAKAAAEKSLEMDSQLAEAHCALGWVRMCYDWDWPAAEKEFKQALDLNPGYSYAHLSYSLFLAAIKKHNESIKEAKKALELDPLTLWSIMNLGLRYYYARRFDEALEQVQKTLEMQPNSVLGNFYTAFMYLSKELYKKAVKGFKKTIELSAETKSLHISCLGYAYALMGNKKEAKKILDEQTENLKQKHISRFWIACIHMALDQKDEAFEWFDKAYEERDPMMMWIKADPIVVDKLHSDSRFIALLKRMNLE